VSTLSPSAGVGQRSSARSSRRGAQIEVAEAILADLDTATPHWSFT
jgi:hypothetical protein